MNDRPIRVVFFDGTQTDRFLGVSLSGIWAAGAWLYRRLGWIDFYRGVSDVEEALEWLAEIGSPRPVAEIQYWGHGHWGCAVIGRELIDQGLLEKDHPLNGHLRRVRDRLLPGGASLFWFRTCETFGGDSGRNFAEAWAKFLGCQTAGHTHIIWLFQSGLCTLAPGARPDWPRALGIKKGTPEKPELAERSGPWAPQTITCFHPSVPKVV